MEKEPPPATRSVKYIIPSSPESVGPLTYKILSFICEDEEGFYLMGYEQHAKELREQQRFELEDFAQQLRQYKGIKEFKTSYNLLQGEFFKEFDDGIFVSNARDRLTSLRKVQFPLGPRVVQGETLELNRVG